MREHLKKYSLLYAEDESNIQGEMAKYFESYFQTVYTASDGHETLELYKRHLPDVVILDINMPKINGLEVARRIRKEHSTTRIIMLTAYSEKELLLQATEIDMSKYLVKPVSPYDLKQALDKVASELTSNSNKSTKQRFDYTIESDGLIYKNKILMPLSKSERIVLRLLIKNFNHTVNYKTFFNSTDGDTEVSNEATLRNIVVKIRKKCPDLIIKNIMGEGYIAYTS